MQNNSYIAVLGDLHGHFTLALKILNRWERENNKKLDLILQVGDFGVWPHPHTRLDEATKRFAEHDPDEISFPDYLNNKGDSLLFYGEDAKHRVDAPIIFIKGNHEDFEYLSDLERQFYNHLDLVPVDDLGRFFYLPNGGICEVNVKDRRLKIGGLGGLENGEAEKDKFTRKEYSRLSFQENVDILLAHEPYKGSFGDKRGSESVRSLIGVMRPKYFFCGHWHENGRSLEQIAEANTKGYLLNEVNFRKRHELNKGCIGILKLGDIDEFSFLNEEWIKEYTRSNYKHI